MIRIIPNLPKIKAHWDRRTSAVPDYLMVPMSDNSVVRYEPVITHPKPFLADHLEKFSNTCKGYERKE